ncbi:MAG: hypothetical protein M1826_007352 [Phylliscum demangeonii]|nr:MAG: hypothetical protein M1826_007352 [Phylliscum demangeonii]
MASTDAVDLADAISCAGGGGGGAGGFLCWSASFYPQPVLNWRRRSTTGTNIDFPTINILGFVCYAVSNLAFLYSPLIRAQYAARNSRAPQPTVRVNDLVFALHAVVLSLVIYSQFWCWGFKRERGARLSWPVAAIFAASAGGVAAVTTVVYGRGIDGGRDARGWAWLDVVYAIGYVKLLVTVVKYVPQVHTNHRRRSTHGWSIHQILLDLAGGLLSTLQLVLDAARQGDWAAVTANPVKLGLGYVSVVFDVIFMLQHYVLYRDRAPGMGAAGAKVDVAGASLLAPDEAGREEEETAVGSGRRRED